MERISISEAAFQFSAILKNLPVESQVTLLKLHYCRFSILTEH